MLILEREPEWPDIVEVEQLHILRGLAHQVMQQQEAHDRPGLVDASLLPHPRAGGTIEVFSPLLTR